MKSNLFPKFIEGEEKHNGKKKEHGRSHQNQYKCPF